MLIRVTVVVPRSTPDTGEHALTAERGMRVGRVAGEQDPALSVGVGESAVHREQRQPLGVAEPHRAPGAFRHDLPESFENLLLGWLFVVAGVIGEKPPQVVSAIRIGHRHRGNQSRRVNPPGGPAAVEIPVEVHIGQ